MKRRFFINIQCLSLSVVFYWMENSFGGAYSSCHSWQRQDAAALTCIFDRMMPTNDVINENLYGCVWSRFQVFDVINRQDRYYQIERQCIANWSGGRSAHALLSNILLTVCRNMAFWRISVFYQNMFNIYSHQMLEDYKIRTWCFWEDARRLWFGMNETLFHSFFGWGMIESNDCWSITVIFDSTGWISYSKYTVRLHCKKNQELILILLPSTKLNVLILDRYVHEIIAYYEQFSRIESKLMTHTYLFT